jgi:membrane protease YdiL (CAAX protease family)
MATTTAAPSRATTRAFPLKFVLVAFAFTWFFWLLAIFEARGLISSLPVPALFVGAFGPMVASVAITAQEGGRAGLRLLLSRVTRWRVAPVWYAVAILGPIALTLATMVLNVVFGGRPPELSAIVGTLPTVVVLSLYMLVQVGIGEEVGWRGYALPKLQSGYSALVSSVILGVLWALWHLPVFFNPDTSYGNTPFWAFLIFLIPFAILYTWVLNGTGGSVLMVMVLHAVTNASVGTLLSTIPEAAIAFSNTDVYLVQAALLWVAAIAVVLVYGATNLSPRPRQVLADAEGEPQSRVR